MSRSLARFLSLGDHSSHVACYESSRKQATDEPQTPAGIASTTVCHHIRQAIHSSHECAEDTNLVVMMVRQLMRMSRHFR